MQMNETSVVNQSKRKMRKCTVEKQIVLNQEARDCIKSPLRKFNQKAQGKTAKGEHTEI